MARLTLADIEQALDEAADDEPVVVDEHDSGRYDCWCCCPCHNWDG